MAKSLVSPLHGIFKLPDPARGKSRCDRPVSPLPRAAQGVTGAAAPPSIARQRSDCELLC